jgi:surface protein
MSSLPPPPPSGQGSLDFQPPSKKRKAMSLLQQLHEQWTEQDNSALLRHSLSFLDVATLLQKQAVCKAWRAHCIMVIDSKVEKGGPRALESKEELKNTVDKYGSMKNFGTSPKNMEDIACKYGYPIDKWNVSKITDMARLFEWQKNFNEFIGSWNVSSVTDMSYMFSSACAFNQDLGSWDVSCVTDIKYMFSGACAFNQDIGSWDVSNVTDMSDMFAHAKSFNQDIGSWDVSSVTDMSGMFKDAHSFNQDLSLWVVSNVEKRFLLAYCSPCTHVQSFFLLAIGQILLTHIDNKTLEDEVPITLWSSA